MCLSGRGSKMEPMERNETVKTSLARAMGIAILGLFAAGMGLGEPAPAALAVFNSYIGRVESRLAQQHRSEQSFLAGEDRARLRNGESIVENVAGTTELPGALVHHWRGTAFAAGASLSDFERLLKNFPAYPHVFSPQVVRARVIAQQGDHLEATMRVHQQHVITVVMDTTYDVTFGRIDPLHGYSLSRSTRIAEIESPGTSQERALSPEKDHGYLWRMNTYWSYEQREDGLYIQIESVSLTRSIPAGLGWAVRPFVESVPRESLQFTLRAACNAIRKPGTT